VPAESFGSIWVLAMRNAVNAPDVRSHFNTKSVGLGGTGARPTKDGLSTTAFPSGIGGIPVEVTEAQTPLVFWSKEFLPDSGGAGEFRGGLSQRIVIGDRDGRGFECNAATFDRLVNAARGRREGGNGAVGRVSIEHAGKAEKFVGKGTIRVPAGGRLVVDLPGGGGFGNPLERAREAVRTDLEFGRITKDAADRLYGLHL